MINEIESAKLTLAQAQSKFSLNSQEEIPWLVWLLENPQSWVALPGAISLFNHDCLHLLLGKTMTASDEAFVIGFTMGSDPEIKLWQIKLFKFFTRHLYPKNYRFLEPHWEYYERGLKYGKTFSVQFNTIDFSLYQNCSVESLRQQFGIDIEDKHLRSIQGADE